MTNSRPSSSPTAVLILTILLRGSSRKPPTHSEHGTTQIREYMAIAGQETWKRNGGSFNQRHTCACKIARRCFRKEHEQLVMVTGPMKCPDGVAMEVKEASEVEKWMDVLNVSVGTDFIFSSSFLQTNFISLPDSLNHSNAT